MAHEDFSGERIAEVYVASRRRLCTLLGGVDDRGLDAPSPATPGWRVRDVIAHLAGIVGDAVAGRLTGPPTPEQTARQVQERDGQPLGDVLAEWDAALPDLLAAVRAGLVAAPLALDMVSHEQDVRTAVGAPRLDAGDPAQADAIRFVAAGFAIGAARRAREAGLPRLGLRAADTGWPVRDWPEGTVLVTAPSEFEIARGLAGRRSAAQLRGWEWAADPGDYLRLLSPFGPLPEADLAE